MQWLSDNLATVLICAALAIVVALILWSLRRDRKSGKSMCGGDCSHCGGGCHAPSDGKTVTLTLQIDGMMCGMCEAHLCDTVRQHFAVRSVKASHQTGTVTIRAKQDIPNAALHAAIDNTGYTLLSVKRG